MHLQVKFNFTCCIEALQLHAAIICHIKFTTGGLALRSNYITEHNVSIILTLPGSAERPSQTDLPDKTLSCKG